MVPHVRYTCEANLFFGEGSTTLTPPNKATLDTLLAGGGCPAWKHLSPEHSFIVRGYTDPSGSPEANMALSLRRAEAVRDYMVSLGISRASIEVVGYGGARPLTTRAGEEAQNRRAVVSLALRGKELHFD
jgi:outer membrane protein OmpA-like peptidoglycan-associated protein